VQQFQAVPVAAALQTAPPKRRDRSCNSFRRCLSPPLFEPLLRRGATVRATARGDALRLCPFNRLPAGIRPSVQQFQAVAPRPPRFGPIPRRGSAVHTAGRGECPSPLPFGPIPLRHRRRRRKRLDCPTLGRLHESETSSRSRFLVAPSAHHCAASPTRGLHPTPARHRSGFGSGRERPSPRVGSHRLRRLASTLGSRLHENRHTDTSASTDGWRRRLELRRARPEPKHPRTRDAIRAALAFDPTARVIDVAADGDRARSLGGDHLRGSV
jgi:hypothetical protein